MFYVLWRQPIVDNGEPYGYFHLRCEDPDDMDWPWSQGRRFTSPPQTALRLRVNLDDADARAYADYAFGSVPLFSARLRTVLDKLGVANLDYFPTQLTNRNEAVDAPEYFAFCLVGKVAAVNEAASEVELRAFGGQGATMYRRMTLNEEAAAGLDMFRLAENLGTILVSERVAQACSAAGIETLKFVPADQWQP